MQPDSHSRAPSRLPVIALALITVLGLARLAFLAFDAPNLSFDEAQYWAWAQTIQLGYYSKPPMVAWAIAATTALFGEGEGAIKLGSALAHLGTTAIIYALGRALYGRAQGAWAALGWASLPAVSLSSVMITTDPFLLLFWALALLALVQAPRRGAGINGWWLVLGLAFGLGLLAKYAMALMLPCLALWLWWDRPARRMLHGGGLWCGLGLGLLIYAPNAVWNALNGFVSYVHTKDNANLGGHLFNPDKMAEFVGGQFGVFGPILMTALIWAAIVQFRRPATAIPSSAPSPDRMLASFCLPVLVVMTGESLLSRANANWTAPAFVAAVTWVSAFLYGRAPRLLWASLILHLAIAVGMYRLDAVRTMLHLPDSARFDPMKRLRGWDAVGDRVSAQLAAHPGARLVADERKLMATLIYYVHPHPFDAIKWNPSGTIHDHFDQTTRLTPDTGTVVLVTEQPDLPTDMRGAFDQISLLEQVDIPIHADYRRKVTIWLGQGFRGYR